MQAYFSSAPGRALVVVALIVVLSAYMVASTPEYVSSDLFATWLAGVAFDAGQFAQIYPPQEPIFTMTPPPGWQELSIEMGREEHRVFPFIYPPLWAWLASKIVSLTDFATVAAYASVINAALLVGTVALAGLAARIAMPLPLYILTGFFAINLTLVGYVATFENQPQILVSFLLVLTIERLRAGDERAAGAALALAAAIKVYPALFVLFLAAARAYRGVAWFAAIGGALGLASIAVAGWELHVLYLAQLSTISNSILITAISINIYGVLGQIFTPGALEFVTATGSISGNSGWYVMAKPAIWGILGTLALAATLIAFARAFSKASPRHQACVLWPLALVVVALLSPIAWPYYLIPTFAFLPCFVAAYGWRRGGAAIFVLIAPFLLPAWVFFVSFDVLPNTGQLVMTLATIALAAAFALLLRAPNLR